MDTLLFLAQEPGQQLDFKAIGLTLLIAILLAAGPALVAWLKTRENRSLRLLAGAGEFLIGYVEKKRPDLKAEIAAAAKAAEPGTNAELHAAVKSVTE